jgi:hypothetical protein
MISGQNPVRMICDGTTCALPISVRWISCARSFYLPTFDRWTCGRPTTGHAAHPTALYRETTASSSPWQCSPS